MYNDDDVYCAQSIVAQIAGEKGNDSCYGSGCRLDTTAVDNPILLCDVPSTGQKNLLWIVLIGRPHRFQTTGRAQSRCLHICTTRVGVNNQCHYSGKYKLGNIIR